MTDDNELKFIPYGIDSLGSGTKHVTRSMIIQQNKCLTDIVVIPIFGVQRDEEDKFYDNFSKVLYFTGLHKKKENNYY